MPKSNDWEAFRRQANGFFTLTAEGFRVFIQYGFVPLVVYLGAQKPAVLPNGESIPFSIAQIFYG